VGISGQPQHMSGVRDAKVVVAINSDPEARIFKHCDYGILGDLYKIVPALSAAFRNA
jgi:electron transfer flavoprotein alpha subunit